MAQQNYNMGITNQQRGSWNNQVTKQNEKIAKTKTKPKAKAKTKTKTKTNTKKTKNTGGRRQSRRSGGRRTKIHRRKIKKKGRQTKRKRRQLKGGMKCETMDCPKNWCHTDAQMTAVINIIATNYGYGDPVSGRISWELGGTTDGTGDVFSVPFVKSPRYGGYCVHKSNLNTLEEFCNNENWRSFGHHHSINFE